MDTIWIAPTLVCYGLAAVAFVVERAIRGGQRTGYALALLGVGVVFHAFDLVARGVQAGNIPVANFAQSLSFLAWVTALASLVLIVRLGIAAIGVFVAPSLFIAVAASSLLMKRGRLRLPEALRSYWLPVHVTIAFLGEALFVIAASVSLVYLFYESRLKSKRPVGAASERLPSLEKLDLINYRLLLWGWVMLSLAIVTGAIWAEATWGHFWSWEPRESWSLLTWLLYAALLESRLVAGWRGRRAATLTIAFFAVLVGSYLGVGLMNPGKHGGSFG